MNPLDVVSEDELLPQQLRKNKARYRQFLKVLRFKLINMWFCFQIILESNAIHNADIRTNPAYTVSI